MNKQLVKDILAAYGPSGHERTAGNVIAEYVRPYADKLWYDALGNLVALKKGKSGKKVMFSSHMDQIGLIVVDIDDEGFLHVANVGGVNPAIATAREYVFENGVRGVSYFENKDKNVGNMTMADVFIDIGAKTKTEAEAKVEVGDMCVWQANFVDMGDRFASSYLDDRICCAILAEAFINCAPAHDIYAVFTVQEEVGCRGAGAAAFAIEPDLNISLDVTGAGDLPNSAKSNMKLGNGACIKAMDGSVIVPVSVTGHLKKLADAHGIKWQNEVLRFGGTDTCAVQRTRGGILSGCISMSTRYIHSPIETCDYADYDACVALTKAVAEEKELPQA